MKICANCGEMYRLECFDRMASARDGHHAKCKRCRSEMDPRKRALWAILSPPQIARIRKRADLRRRRSDPKARERERSAAREPDARRRHTERRRKRWAANPEPFRARQRVANERRRFGAQAGADYAEALRGDPCGYCGAPTEHVDHIDSLASGGSADWTNLTASCASCNLSKSSKPLVLFLAERV